MALPAVAQKPGETTYGKYEFNLFGGGSWFKRQDPRPYFDLGDGGVAGVRVVQNYWKYISIEEALTLHGVNNATFTKPGTFDSVSFGTRQRQFMVNPVFHFTPREARFRPFVTAGAGFNWLSPTEAADRAASLPNGNGLGAPVDLKTGTGALFNYGAGLKAKFMDRVGLRMDVRGFLTNGVDMGIGRGNSRTVVQFEQNPSPLNSLQLTGGLTFYMGKLAEAPIGDFRAGVIEASTQAACPGDAITFRLPVTNTMNGMQSKFKWTADGKDAGTGDTLTLRAPDKAGTLPVRAIVEADSSQIKDKNILKYLRKNPIAATARDASVRVKEYKTPGVTASANPARIGTGGTSTLTATPSLSECSGDASYNWTLEGGGALSGNGATRTLTASGLNLACGTSRTLTANVTIRDGKGATSSASVPVNVNAPPCPPPPPPPPPPALRSTQFDDILFAANGNTRVNNCGKRTLDRVYEQAMASGDYDILLVGHIDSTESKIRRRRNQKAIDRERVENAAAYLIAGDQPCKRFDRNRVKVAVMADNQSSPLRTALCEDSVRERAGSKVRARDDKAKFRRVEVWLVPRAGKGELPSGISGIETAPDVKGCPK